MFTEEEDGRMQSLLPFLSEISDFISKLSLNNEIRPGPTNPGSLGKSLPRTDFSDGGLLVSQSAQWG